ncbi:uncharacterized protein AtWU_09597 [Aspergillus tubingensis]|uniref:uncharacterized protein n=1 Tax=Aspergillus tubingensis TaxID=5068 RepID=UPI001579FE17|nr:uncharacterized protein AtWU_09597 [Aspergillus tubingensis]GFN19792.1 hypothetical protein AtWU_09597 [Aspergillus tubingensis]
MQYNHAFDTVPWERDVPFLGCLHDDGQTLVAIFAQLEDIVEYPTAKSFHLLIFGRYKALFGRRQFGGLTFRFGKHANQLRDNNSSEAYDVSAPARDQVHRRHFGPLRRGFGVEPLAVPLLEQRSTQEDYHCPSSSCRVHKQQDL